MTVFNIPLAEIFGYIAGICTATCFLPQTYRTIRTHNVDGLSLLSYIIYAIGMFCWILYGFSLNSLQMIIFNTPAVILALIIIAEIVWNRYLKRQFS